jgi:hypothetical protein
MKKYFTRLIKKNNSYTQETQQPSKSDRRQDEMIQEEDGDVISLQFLTQGYGA